VNLDGDSKGDEANAPVVGKKFDFANGLQLHTWVKGAYYRDISLQAESRLQRSLDADFYDDKQFTEAEKEDYEADGRMPPLQYNIVKQTINWILGSYLRQTYDWNVFRVLRTMLSLPFVRQSSANTLPILTARHVKSTWRFKML
jgi:hypothetical protein